MRRKEVRSINLIQFKAPTARHLHLYRTALSCRDNESVVLAAAKQRLTTIEQAQALVQSIAKQVQESVHQQIATVVTRAIQTVFDERYEFRIEFEKKRGRTEARLTFLKSGEEINPLTGSGGGLLDVAAFALNLICMLLTRPHLRRFLCVDEPFRMIDRVSDKSEKIRGLLEELSRELEIQIVMVTHDPNLATGKIISLS